jgi:hypothetical protein
MAYEHPGPGEIREMLGALLSDEAWEVVADYDIERDRPDGTHQLIHLRIRYSVRHGYKVEAVDVAHPDRCAYGNPAHDLREAINNTGLHWMALDR